MTTKTTKRSRRKKDTLSPALAPTTQQSDPGQGRSTQVLLLPQRTAGVRVNEDTALTCAAVWACVRAISEDLAALPCHAYRKRADGGREVLDGNTVDWMLQTQANPETVAFCFRETLIAHALTWGNGYAEIERDAAGRPVWLWQLTPDRVCPERDSRGRLYYDVYNPGDANTALPAEDVLHVRGLGFDGLVGYSVIRMAARSIGAGIAASDSAASFFANDSTPGGILSHPARLSPEAAKNLRESWKRRHGGPLNRREVAVLEEGLTWNPTGLPPRDAQLIEAMQFTPAEICRWFRVPPHKIADLLRAPFSNIEEQEIAYVIDALVPWAVRVEQEVNAKLFRGSRLGAQFVKHNFAGRLRGNVTARSQFYTQLLDRGVFSINDVLELEDRNPVGPDGDKRFVQQNMQLLDKAGEEPPPGQVPAAPATPTAKPKPKAEGMALLPVLEDACKRVFRREEHRVNDALKKTDGNAEALLVWLDSTEEDRRTYLIEALSPGVLALADLLGGTSTGAEVALGVFASSHLKAFRNILGVAPDAVADYLSNSWVAAQELFENVTKAFAAEGVANG